MNKTALIIGITGMVGSHLADFLLAKGYRVYGTTRSDIQDVNLINIKDIKDKITLIKADVNSQIDIDNAITISNPDEIYNFGGISFSPNSWISPEYTASVNGLGPLRILESIRKFNTNIRFYQANSSEIYGNLKNIIVDESTIPNPKTPYGIAKLYAMWLIDHYRKNYGIFACNGITFNHESERRGLQFVTRKIANGVANIYLGHQSTIELGNLDVCRDWGYTPDYVEAMWLMLQHHTSDDYIICTGQLNTLKDFIKIAFETIGISDFSSYIKINQEFIRSNDINFLCGSSNKIKRELGWSPTTDLNTLVRTMVNSDIKALKQ